MFKLSKKIEYLILSLALCIGVLSTALASPLYPIYLQSWNISTTEIGYAFIAYMIGVVFSLLFFNQFTNKYGFKKVVCIGLAICTIALLYSAISTNIIHLCISRFIIGISSGLLSTSTVIGLSLKYPFTNVASAGKITSLITVFGFSLGPLIGGLVADHTAFPLAMPYYIIAAFSSLILILCFFIQYDHQIPLLIKKTKLWNIPQYNMNRLLFFPCAISAFCCFAVFSLYAALSGQFLATLPIQQSATLTGISISIILFISAFTQYFFKEIKEATSLIVGLTTLLIGCLSLISSQILQHSSLLIVSILVIGFGHGLTLNPAYFIVSKITQTESPAIFSTFLLIAYQGTIWPILISSILIDYFGVTTSLIIFSLIILINALWVFKHIKIIQLQEA